MRNNEPVNTTLPLLSIYLHMHKNFNNFYLKQFLTIPIKYYGL